MLIKKETVQSLKIKNGAYKHWIDSNELQISFLEDKIKELKKINDDYKLAIVRNEYRIEEIQEEEKKNENQNVVE